jgi:hypothetical protein
MERVQLDEEKLEALRSWGEKLRQASGEEYAAVGRAILLLVEEIDRLHIELWHARMRSREGEPATDLHTRLQETIQREEVSDPVEPQPETAPKTAPTGSPQAWIAALRRQK